MIGCMRQKGLNGIFRCRIVSGNGFKIVDDSAGQFFNLVQHLAPGRHVLIVRLDIFGMIEIHWER